MTDPRLTIVLPLKGRHLFTLRFLWHANAARLPYRILIADGQVHPQLAQLLEHPKVAFRNLDIDYVRYPDDATFSHFYAKMADALSRVSTPYAVIADNDDFLIGSGVERSLDFLDANPDYICCGGGLAGFSVYSATRDPGRFLTGRMNRYAFRYTPFDESADYGSPSVVERLRAGARNWWSYYAVFRTAGLRTVWREVLEFDFSDLQILEFFCAMRTLTLGKARSDPACYGYMRQYGTSLGSSFKHDWVHHLLRSRFTTDFNAMIGRVSSIAATADGVDRNPVDEMLRAICDEWLRDFLKTYYGELQALKQVLRDRAPWLIAWLKERKRYFAARECSTLLRKLSENGASNAEVARFADELALIKDVVEGIKFREFVFPYLGQFDKASPQRGNRRAGALVGDEAL